MAVLDQNGSPFTSPDDFALPHVWTYASVMGSASRTYWHDRWDEAMRHAREDALVMRNDCHLMRLLQERKLAVASLPWHLEVPDERDPFQVRVRDDLQARLKGQRGLKRLFMSKLEAIWYGRYGINCRWRWVKGPDASHPRALQLGKWRPVNGDKIGHHFDGTPYVLVYSPAARSLPGEVVITTRGFALLLRGDWAERVLVHTHEPDDMDFFDSEQAEAVFGVGVRSRLFWIDWIKREWLANVTTFMQRVGLGVTIWYFEAGNPASEAQATTAAKEQSGRVNILWPRSPQGKGVGAGVERLEVPSAGAAFLVEAQKWLGQLEELYVVGQTMSGGADNESGLGGSGRANFAKDTKHAIRDYDAGNLADSLTGDDEQPGLLSIMKRWTWPEADFPVWFRFQTQASESKEKLDAASKAWEMGATLKESEVLGAAGLSQPAAGDRVLSRQQQEEQQLAQQTAAQGEQQQRELAARQQGQAADRQHQMAVEQLRQQAEEQRQAAQQQPVPVPYRRRRPRRYRQADEGRWVTIGGQKGEDGKRHGGSPVFIQGGRIVKGAPSLAGRKIDALQGDPEESTHRKELKQGKDYARAVWAKKARAAGLDAGALHQLAAEVQAHDAEHVKARVQLLRRSRDLLAHYGYDARALTTNLRSGRVEDEVPALDVVADSMMRSHPEQFAGHEGDPAGRLLDLLAEGNPQPVSEDQAYQHAFDELEARAGQDGGGGAADESLFDSDDTDDEPFPGHYRHRRRPDRYAAQHAPAGGVDIGGRHYTGGEFIPADVVAGATLEEKARLAGGAGEAKPAPAPAKSKRSARREREQAEAAAAHEKAHAEWEARADVRQERREDVKALREMDTPLGAEKRDARAREVDVENQRGEALLGTPDGRKEYGERAGQYAGLQAQLWDATYDDGLPGSLRGSGFSEKVAARVEDLRLKGKAAVEKAGARYTQAVEKRLAWQERRPDPSDDTAEETWLEKDGDLAQRAEEFHDDLAAEIDAHGRKIEDAVRAEADRVLARLDREEERDPEPEEEGPTGPGHDEHEREVQDWSGRTQRVLGRIDVPDERRGREDDETPQEDALADLQGRAEEIDDPQRTSPDEAEGKLRDYLRAASETVTLLRTNGNRRAADQVRATAAHALRALRALEADEGGPGEPAARPDAPPG